MTGVDGAALRRYLLGQGGDAERDRIERACFDSEEALHRLAGVEGELIEEYLEGRLTPDERVRFDDVYLASPLHRQRVEIVRRLADVHTHAARKGAAWRRPSVFLPLAASLVIAAGAALWLQPWSGGARGDAVHRAASDPAPGGEPEARPEPPSPIRTIVAFSLSPVAVRGDAAGRTLILPVEAEAIIRLDLEGTRPVERTDARVVIRTVEGQDVWGGPAEIPADLAPGVVARVEIPASRLRADDYFVSLLTADAGGLEQERYRYFLRARSR